MWNLLIGPLTGLVSDVVKRVLPAEKISEADRIKLEAELKLAIIQADWQRFEKEVADRISARDLAKAELEKGNALTNILAAIHRPLWSFVTLAIYVWSLISPQIGLPIQLTEVHKDIMMTVIIFYFGGRSIEKIFKTIKG